MALQLLKTMFSPAQDAPATPPSGNELTCLKQLMRSDHPMNPQEITDAMRWIDPRMLDICRWSFTWGVKFAEARYDIND